MTEAQIQAAGERLAWEAEHLHGPNADYLSLGGGQVVKASDYDRSRHGRFECRDLECGYVDPNAAHIDH